MKGPCRRGLSQTSPSGGRLPRFRLEFDDGTATGLRGNGLIGRGPVGNGDVAQLITIADHTVSVSRTHLAFGVGESGLWIQDCGSTNGSEIEINAQRYSLEVGVPVGAPAGCTIHLGARQVRVQAVSGRAVIGAATVDWGVATQAAAARRQNQDSFGAQAPVFVVADGIGGHTAGNLASREVVAALLTLAGQRRVTAEMVAGALEDARARLRKIPASAGRPPGTTVSGVIVTHDDENTPQWMVLNLGDSRTYRLNGNEISQITVDHSLAQELIDVGMVSSDQAWVVPRGNLLTRAVLADTDHRPDMWLLPMRPRDRILVCSDGLTRELDDKRIADILQAVSDPWAAADALVGAAAAEGCRDDVTALVADAVAMDRAASTFDDSAGPISGA